MKKIFLYESFTMKDIRILLFASLAIIGLSSTSGCGQTTSLSPGDSTLLVPGALVSITLKTGERISIMRISTVLDGKITGEQFSPIKGQNQTIQRRFSVSDVVKIEKTEPADLPTSADVFIANGDTTRLYHVETEDGNEYMGKVLFEDPSIIRIRTGNLGLLVINKSEIKEMYEVRTAQLKNGDFWSENPQSTRYFMSPNGYGLKAGEGYYQNVWVLFNQFSVGITDNFSIGMGLMPLFLFAGGTSPIWLTPKFSIPVSSDRFNLGVGALTGTWFGSSETKSSGFGIAYGTATVGTRDANFSFGLGYGYAGGSWSKAPTMTFSAMVRTGKRSYFITENYFVSSATTTTILLMIGGRSISRGKTGIDYGLMVPLASGSLVAIPWLGITVPFGKK